MCKEKISKMKQANSNNISRIGKASNRSPSGTARVAATISAQYAAGARLKMPVENSVEKPARRIKKSIPVAKEQMKLPFDELPEPVAAARPRVIPAEPPKPAPKEQPKASPVKKPERSRQAEPPKLPASDIMKKVAARVPDSKAVKKVFTPEEIAELVKKREQTGHLNRDENAQITIEYRRIKKKVKRYEAEMPVRNQIVAFPSLKGLGEWYKMIDISALYTAYRVMPRLGLHSRVYADTDRFSKAKYVIGLQRIEEFAAKMEKYEGAKTHMLIDGIYIFDLPRVISDDEIAELYRTEEVRRDKMHNILKPRAMDVGAYQKILAVIRQMLPKLNNLPKHYFWTTGQKMSESVLEISRLYYNFADGIIDKEEAGKEIINACNVLLGGLSHLAEIGVWRIDAASAMGEVVNMLKEQVKEDFCENDG